MNLYVSRSLKSTVPSLCILRQFSRTPGARHVKQLQTIRRAASTSTSPGSNDTQSLQEEPRDPNSRLSRARYVLASSSRLRAKSAFDAESLVGPLIAACERLSGAGAKGKINISVYGEGETSARDFVTVLLDDPLSSDPSLRLTVRERWTSQNEPRKGLLRLQQTRTDPIDEDTITLPSAFFTQFTHPVTLKELGPCPLSSENIRHLLESDIFIFVVSPFHAPTPSLLFAFSQSPHALLVVSSALNPTSPSADYLRSQVASKHGYDASRVILVDVSLAVRGAATLSADPSSASAVNAFQKDVLASGIPMLLRTLTDIVSLGPSRLRADTESAIAKRAVVAVREVIRQAKEETREVRVLSSTLREEALEERERLEVEILGGDTELTEQNEPGRVSRGVERVAADVKSVIDYLAWYRLPFVVDDVSSRLDRAVEQAFAKEFENELMFHTGRLSSLQSHFVSRTTLLLASLPPAFYSPILQNSLAQLTSAPSFRITPTSPSPHLSQSSFPNPSSSAPTPALLTPLRARTAQLAHATRSLHLSAQRLLLVTFASTSLSFSGGTALFLTTSLDLSSAIGASLLGTLIGLRWAVGRWTRAKDKWWGAYARVGDGLARDLDVVVRSVLDQQVCVVPEEAYKGLQKIVERQEDEVGNVEDEVAELEAALEKSQGQDREDSRKS